MKMELLRDKKGEELGSQVMFFVFFFMMVIVALGLAGGVYSFFGKAKIDLREQEAELLYSKVVKCLEEETFFSDEVDNDEDLFYEKCGLSKKVLEKEHLVYIKTTFDGDGEFFVGVRDFLTQCGLEARHQRFDLPNCVSGEVFIRGQKYEVLIGSSQDARRILS
jgi:hypothetical protein